MGLSCRLPALSLPSAVSLGLRACGHREFPSVESIRHSLGPELQYGTVPSREALFVVCQALANRYQCRVSVLSVELVEDGLVDEVLEWRPHGMTPAIPCTGACTSGCQCVPASVTQPAVAPDSEAAIPHMRLLWNPWNPTDPLAPSHRRFDPIFPSALFSGCSPSQLPTAVWQAIVGGSDSEVVDGHDLTARYTSAEAGACATTDAVRAAVDYLVGHGTSIRDHLASPQLVRHYDTQLEAMRDRLRRVQEKLRHARTQRVAIIGNTGHGKSTLGNTILNRELLFTSPYDVGTAVPTELRWAPHAAFRVSADLVDEERLVGWFADFVLAKKVLRSLDSRSRRGREAQDRETQAREAQEKEMWEKELSLATSRLSSLFGRAVGVLAAALEVVRLWQPRALATPVGPADEDGEDEELDDYAR